MPRPNNITLCSFCGKSHAEVKKLIAGPGVWICDNCVTLGKRTLEKTLPADVQQKDNSKITLCSFCGRSRGEAKEFMAGPGVQICDRCITLCEGVLEKELSGETRPPNKTKSEICSFCGKSHTEVKWLVAGPGVYICDNCINLSYSYMEKAVPSDVLPRERTKITLCSFCGKSHAEVKKLIAGPGVYICNNCITLCMSVGGKESKLRALKQGLTNRELADTIH